MTDHIQNMKTALHARAQSAHKTHKVGAAIRANGILTARSNFFPQSLERTIGHHQKLGNASTTIHAEIAAILAMPIKTDKATLYVTEFPCPNCAKAIIEAGITELYISAETHKTALGQKIQPFFMNASLPFFTHAGIAVIEVGEKLKSLNKPEACEGTHKSDEDTNHPFATCIAYDKKGEKFNLSAYPKTPNCLPEDKATLISDQQKKYETALQPINRLLMICAREGLKIVPETLYSSQTPTAREFVNMIGAGYTTLSIGNPELCRDEFGLKALEQLKEHNIISIKL